MRQVDMLMFDLDGTLIDSREDIARAVNATLRHFRKPERTTAEITSFIGLGVQELLLQALGSSAAPPGDESIRYFERYFQQHPAEASVVYPDVRQVLDAYRAKQLLIVSNRSAPLATVTLKAFGLDHYFSRIIGADERMCVKPLACPVERGLAAASMNRARCIMIGDMEFDIMAGRRAGVLTCGVTYGYGSRQKLQQAGPDFLIDSLAELVNIIE